MVVGTIYVIGEPKNNMYKIGMTCKETVYERLKSLQTGNAFPLSIYKTYSTKNYQPLELMLHKEFEAYKANTIKGNEWFKFDQSQLESVYNYIEIMDKRMDVVEYIKCPICDRRLDVSLFSSSDKWIEYHVGSSHMINNQYIEQTLDLSKIKTISQKHKLINKARIEYTKQHCTIIRAHIDRYMEKFYFKELSSILKQNVHADDEEHNNMIIENYNYYDAVININECAKDEIINRFNENPRKSVDLSFEMLSCKDNVKKTVKMINDAIYERYTGQGF